MNAPLWLADAGVRHLLNFVVDRLDKAEANERCLSRPIKVDSKSYPALFKAEYESEKERYWSHLEEMASWGWFQIKLNKQTPGQAKYECNPRLDALDNSRIREVLGRPVRIKSPSEEWREAVYSELQAPDAVREQVARYRLEIPGRSPNELVGQLNLLHALVDEPLLLREASAKLFWGQSKVLDKRQALVSAILGMEECPFPEMPVQLHVYLPKSGFDGILFIENQTTFEQAVRDESKKYSGLALVFASGFKGSAKRLRSSTGASVYFAASGAMSEGVTQGFLAWLRGVAYLPSWFWGDLDYSGVRILASLRKTFDGMRAWEPGYQPMLEALKGGEGHEPKAAGKENQSPLNTTGCAFADSELLPTISQIGRFVDQEGY